MQSGGIAGLGLLCFLFFICSKFPIKMQPLTSILKKINFFFFLIFKLLFVVGKCISSPSQSFILKRRSFANPLSSSNEI